MKTLEIRNGDLALAPGGYATLTGAAKVKQDLGVAVREPLGCDRFHPNWGTTLSDLTGSAMSGDAESLIQSEITRLVRNYAAIQDDLLAADYGQGVKPRFDIDEIVSDLSSIEIQRREDAVYIRVKVKTMSGSTTTLVTSVGI